MLTDPAPFGTCSPPDCEPSPSPLADDADDAAELGPLAAALASCAACCSRLTFCVLRRSCLANESDEEPSALKSAAAADAAENPESACASSSGPSPRSSAPSESSSASDISPPPPSSSLLPPLSSSSSFSSSRALSASANKIVSFDHKKHAVHHSSVEWELLLELRLQRKVKIASAHVDAASTIAH